MFPQVHLRSCLTVYFGPRVNEPKVAAATTLLDGVLQLAPSRSQSVPRAERSILAPRCTFNNNVVDEVSSERQRLTENLCDLRKEVSIFPRFPE